VNVDQKKITETLEGCLCSDEEMEKYRQQLRNFQNTWIEASSNSGLFNVAGVDHMDD
jgi:hypothetical protein